jgi:hypothetical protein
MELPSAAARRLQAHSTAPNLEANSSNNGSSGIFRVGEEPALPQGFAEGEAITLTDVEHRVIVHDLGTARS